MSKNEGDYFKSFLSCVSWIISFSLFFPSGRFPSFHVLLTNFPLYVSSRALGGGTGSPSANQARSKLVLATATALRATVSLMDDVYLFIWVYNDIIMLMRIYLVCIVCCPRSSRMHERERERERPSERVRQSMLSFRLHSRLTQTAFFFVHSFHSTRGNVLD